MKANLYKLILCGFSAALFLTACSSEDQLGTSSSDGQVAVQLTAGFSEARAVDASWDAQDKIGIAMLASGTQNVLNNYSNNSYFTADGTSKFSPTSADQILYFPVDGSEVTFKSYYPYSPQANANNLVLPVDLSDQTYLAELDIMTAEHLTGKSKDDANVELKFYHRLSKVMVELTAEDEAIDLTGCGLVVDGLKTAGSYDVMNEKLTVTDGSVKEVTIPLHGTSGKAIVMPRAAGEGVVFKVTTKAGGVYTASLKTDVVFEAGYKYTLHINLRKTPAEISAVIEPWVEGPETTMEGIRVVTGLKDTEGFATGDVLDLFLKDGADFAKEAQFTYNKETGKWNTQTPLYWEDIEADPAQFKGASVIATKLNDTQMDDILLSDVTNVDQYTGVNLVMNHAGAKAEVTLKSTDNTFTAADLAGATITFPGYQYTGSINEKGEFVIGDGTKDIVAEDGVAIFPPQSVQVGDVIAKVTINGRDYEIKATEENFDFEAGVAKKITLDMKKAEVEVSSKIAEWTEETIEFDDVRIGTSTLKPNEGDLKDGDILHLFTGNDTERVEQGTFIYNEATKSWTNTKTNEPLYWEDMPKEGNLYASIERPAVSADSKNNQLADYIVAVPITNDGGVSNTALNFEFKHQVAQVVVILKSSDGSYSDAELKTATVILPSYTIGGGMNNGVFVPGTATGNITLPGIATSLTDKAYLQAQTITQGNTVVRVTLNDRVYNGTKDHDVVYENGKLTTLIVDLKKTAVSVGTNIAPWSDGSTEKLEHMFFQTTTGSVSGLTDGDKLTFTKVDKDNNAGSSNKGEVKGETITTENTWYRDDFAKGDKIFAATPDAGITITPGSSSFPYTVTGTNEAKNDLKTAVATVGDGTNLDFKFSHAMSEVTLNVIAGEGFTNEELRKSDALTAALNNFFLSGNVSVADGKATASGSVTSSFSPTKLAAAETVDGKEAAMSYQAIIYPQTIAAGTKLATITLNGLTYEVKFYADEESDGNKKFEAGKNTTINVILKKTGISFTASVAGWGTAQGGDVTIQ